MKPPRNIVGPAIRRQRYQAGLTQPQLAARCARWGWDLSRETLAKIESRLRWVSDFEMVCLANALGIAPQDLLSTGAEMRKSLKEMFRQMES